MHVQLFLTLMSAPIWTLLQLKRAAAAARPPLSERCSLFRCAHLVFCACAAPRHKAAACEAATLAPVASHQREAHARMPRNYSIPSRTFWCDKCTFSTHSKRAAALHFVDHLSQTDARALVCTFCDFRTAYVFSLRRHLKRFHSAETLC